MTQRLNDVVLVEVSTREPSVVEVDVRSLAGAVSGRVLDAEVTFQRYGVQEQDA